MLERGYLFSATQWEKREAIDTMENEATRLFYIGRGGEEEEEKEIPRSGDVGREWQAEMKEERE